jgi:hypothetical protein
MKKRKSSVKKSSGVKGDRQIEGMIGAAIDAIVELGHAAEDIKSSLVHAQAAQKKAKPLIDPVKRATVRATRAVRKTVSRK